MIHFSFTLTYLEIYLISISIISFTMYAYDKLQALKNLTSIQRVSEIKLLLSSLLGGTIGSIISMVLFRHKIKKASFIIKFLIIVILQIIAIFFYIKRIILWKIKKIVSIKMIKSLTYHTKDL